MRLGSGLMRGTIKVPALRDARRSAARLPQHDLRRQVASFVSIGVLSTIGYVLLYLLLRTALPALAANAVSLLITAVANTAVNRRITFGIRGRAHAAGHQVKGLIAFAAGLALTSGALAGLHAISARPGLGWEVCVLVAANLAATILRFLLYRSWVFGGGTRAGAGVRPGPRRPVDVLEPSQPNGSTR
jgi:putative flippase GtrA